MGESACLMQPFSYSSSLPKEANQGNPMHALGESISFGRFTSESLSWEKWSTFSHKRYVEEAERYSQPGSVAQKKAFFEAHYKRVAAKKAAALLEQQNCVNNTPTLKVEGKNCDTHDSQTVILNSQGVVNEQEKIETQDTKVDLYVNSGGNNSNTELVDLEIGKMEGTDSVTKHEALVDNSIKDESLEKHENIDNQDATSGSELSGTPQMERPLLKQNSKSTQDVSSSISKKKPLLSSFKPSVCRKEAKIPSPPAKPSVPIYPKKENNVTPKKATIDTMDKKRSPAKSLHKLLNFTPSREPDRLITPATRKIESSRVTPSCYKESKVFATPLRTPTMASANVVSKHPSATPFSENKRAKTPVDPSASGSKTTGPRWHILSAVSKSLSACRKKLQSPTISTPFILRTEERAARRKQKLEEKFNAKEEQKVQLQTKLKEKAGTELRKLRQSLCFKARPLPDFYRERETPKSQIKKPQSPKLGRKPSVSTFQETSSLPPLTSSTKKNSFKDLKKDNRNPTHSLAALAEAITHENTSPNIQH